MYATQQPPGKRNSSREERCPAYKAYFRLTAESRVRIFFPKKDIPPEVAQLHFGKGHFEMPFALELPHPVLSKLGIDYFKIHSGLYPVQESQDFFKVDF